MIFRSIKTRLVWSHLLAILIVNAILGGMTYRFMAGKLIAAERHNLEFIVNHTADMLRSLILKKGRSLQQVAKGREFVEYLQTYRELALAQYLAGFKKQFPQISFVNKDGGEEVKVKDGVKSQVLVAAYDQQFVDRTQASPNEVEFVFDSELHNQTNSLLYLAISKYSYFGDRFEGTLLAAVPHQDLLQEIATTHIHSEGYLALWGDGKNDIFVQDSGHGHSHNSEGIMRMASYHKDGRQFLKKSGTKAHITKETILGVESLVAYVPLPEFQLNLLATLPHDKITLMLRQLRNRSLLVFFGLCFVAVILSYLLARSITRPIRKLTEVTREIADGGMETQGLAAIKHRADEVGVLVNSFETMINSLWSTMVSRDYIDSIFAAMAESIIVISENGGIKYVNDSACQLLGYSEKELLGLSIGDILADGLKIPDFIGQLRQKQEWQEAGYRHKHGSDVPVLFSCSSLVGKEGGKETVCVASDISSLQKAREALEQNEYYLKALMKSLPSGLLVIDAENRMIIDANPTSCLIFKCSREQLIGKICFELIAPVGEVDEWPPIVTPEKPIINMEAELVVPNAPRVPISMSVQAIRLRDSLIYINSFIDISESKKTLKALQESEEKLRSLSLTDELTGLLNRRGFFTMVEKQLEIYARSNKTAYILYADIDGLKDVNDTQGHSVGDKLLCSAAKALEGVSRKSDIVGRLGGDEFGVLLTNAENEEAILRRLDEKVSRFNSEASHPFELSISVGIVTCNESDQVSPCLLEGLLSTADAKMYAIKKRRKDKDHPAPKPDLP
ncbi:MAG: diguanylate cyclase [Thermodesulfobacteriota bacterium]